MDEIVLKAQIRVYHTLLMKKIDSFNSLLAPFLAQLRAHSTVVFVDIELKVPLVRFS